MYSIVTIIR